MLVDIPKDTLREDTIANLVASISGVDTDVTILHEGVYQIGHFNFNRMLPFEHEQCPELDILNSYGVCDSYEQILDIEPQLKESEDRFFVISVTPIEKSKQPPSGGWRWHKWGPYIGTQRITTEYIYDEPKIEKVFCYHIYELYL